MTEVEIEYCVPCGLLDNAQAVQKDLLEEFGQDLDGVKLVTGDGGVFKVRVEGDLVFDGQESTYDETAVREAVSERL